MAIGFWMNNKNCYGCKTCSIACKSEKQLDKGVLLRHVTGQFARMLREPSPTSPWPATTAKSLPVWRIAR